MSTPSFSSFPPSFESFPDFEQPNNGGSSNINKGEESVHTDRAEAGKRRAELTPLDSESERKRRKKRHKHEPESERKKHEKYFFEAGVPGLYIIDTAGDRMTEVYGKLHAGDIPRYRRTGCKLASLCSPRSSVLMLKRRSCFRITSVYEDHTPRFRWWSNSSGHEWETSSRLQCFCEVESRQLKFTRESDISNPVHFRPV